jgi:hypothetical protein
MAVILSHAVPVGLLWVAVSLGLHDWMQDRLHERIDTTGNHPLENRQQRPEIARSPIISAPSR